MVILCHGIGGHKLYGFFPQLVDAIVNNFASVVTFDFSGNAESQVSSSPPSSPSLIVQKDILLIRLIYRHLL